MNKFLTLLILVALTSCVSWTAQNHQRLNSWLGSSETDLINVWGMPSKTYNLNDKKYVAFEESSLHSYKGTAHTSYCKVTFTIEKNKIVSWNYSDDLCFDFIKAK